MSNDTTFTGIVSSNNAFGAEVVLEDGRRGFLPATGLFSEDRKEGDSVTVVVTDEHDGKLRLAIAGTQSREPVVIFLDDIEALLGRREERTDAEGPDPTIAAFLEAIENTRGAPLGFVGASTKDGRPGLLDGLVSRLPPLEVILFDEHEKSEEQRDSEQEGAIAEVAPSADRGAAKKTRHGKKRNKKRNRGGAQKSDGHVQQGGSHAQKSGDHAQKGVWRELRELAEGNSNFRINLKRVEGQNGLVGYFKGVKCFLPKSEVVSEFNVDSVSTRGSVQWVKIVSVSRARRSVIVSMRLDLSRDELLAAGEALKAKVTHQKQRREERQSADAQAWKDFESLVEGQEVHGIVVNILKKPGNGDGKSFSVYFVKVGTQLVGAMGEHRVPFEPGTRTPVVLKVGDQVSVRVTRKFTKIDEKTGAEKPKVDLSMRRPTDQNRSGGRNAKGKSSIRFFQAPWRPAAASFASACGKTNEALAAATEEEGRGSDEVSRHSKSSRADRRRGQRKGKGKSRGGQKSSLNLSVVASVGSDSAGTAVGDALLTALARRREQEQ